MCRNESFIKRWREPPAGLPTTPARTFPRRRSLLAGQNEKALAQAKRVYELEPSHPLGRWNLGFVYISQGMYAEAIDLSEKNLKDDPTNQRVLWNAGFAYAKAGRRDKAEEVINKFNELEKNAIHRTLPNRDYLWGAR